MSEKVYDNKGRWRNKTVSFRVSEIEAEKIDRFVRMSGLTKQDYLASRALQKEIKVIPSTRVLKGLKEELKETCYELKMLNFFLENKSDLMQCIQQCNSILERMGEKDE